MRASQVSEQHTSFFVLGLLRLVVCNASACSNQLLFVEWLPGWGVDLCDSGLHVADKTDFAIHNCKVTHERRPSKTGIFVSRVFVIFQLGSLYFILYWLSVAFLGLKFFSPYISNEDAAASESGLGT